MGFTFFSVEFVIISIIFFVMPLAYILLNKDEDNAFTTLSSISIIFYSVLCLLLFE